MARYIKEYIRIASPAVNRMLSDIEEKLFQIENDRKVHIEKINHDAAIKRASTMGLRPIDYLSDLRNLLNEKIIVEVKRNKLRHIDVAGIARIPRTTVTAIMNRHIENVTVDYMIQILNILGVSLETKFTT